MSVGVTGSRSKPRKHQITAMMEWLLQHKEEINEIHHGDCIGWDQTVHRAVANHDKNITIHIHPPKNPVARAYMQLENDDSSPIIVHDEKKYLDRNDEIVAVSDCIIAAPKSLNRRHSGTWYTIRKAVEAKKQLIIFM